MASNHKFQPRQSIAGGIDRSTESHLGLPGHWYNAQDVAFYRKRVRQTQPIVKVATIGAFGSNNDVMMVAPIEAATNASTYFVLSNNNAVKTQLINSYTAANETTVQFVQGPVYTDTATDADIKQCLVTGWAVVAGVTQINAGPLTITISSGTTFNAAINGVAMAGNPFTIATRVPLDVATGLTAFFDVTTGFTVGKVWTWTQAAFFASETVTTSNAADFVRVGTDIYFSFFNSTIGRIYRLRGDVVTELGYQKVFGRHVEVYYNHIFVSHFTTPRTTANANSDYTIGWSDLNNPDLFFSNLINEADEYQFENDVEGGGVYNRGITGMKTLAGQLAVYTNFGLYTANYVGLPNVMQFNPVLFNVGTPFPLGLVETDLGHVFPSQNNFYLFNGVMAPVVIGDKIADLFFSDLPPTQSLEYALVRGFYNRFRREAIWYYTSVGNTYAAVGYNKCIILSLPNSIWTAQDVRWTTRKLNGVLFPTAPFNDGVVGNNIDGELVYGLPNRSVGRDFSSSYTLSYSGVIQEPTPQLETHDFTYGDGEFLKEVDTIFFDTNWSNGLFVKVEISARDYVSSPVNYIVVGDGWFPNPETLKRFTFKKMEGRVFRYRFTWIPPTSPALGMRDMVFKQWGENVLDLQSEAP